MFGAGVATCCGRGSTLRHSTRASHARHAVWPRRPSSEKRARRLSSVPLATTKIRSPRRAAHRPRVSSSSRRRRALRATARRAGDTRSPPQPTTHRRRARNDGSAHDVRITARRGSSFRRGARGDTRSAWCRSEPAPTPDEALGLEGVDDRLRASGSSSRSFPSASSRELSLRSIAMPYECALGRSVPAMLRALKVPPRRATNGPATGSAATGDAIRAATRARTPAPPSFAPAPCVPRSRRGEMPCVG